VLIVDDGSSDNTWKHTRELVAKYPDVYGIRLSRNYGKDAAIAAGLSQCRGETAVIIDADLQHPPELLAEFYRLWKEDGYQVVEAVKRRRDDEPVLRRMCSRLFGLLAGAFTPLDLQNSTDYKLLSRPVIEAWKQMGESRLFFRGTIDWLGFRRATVEFDVGASLRPVSTWSRLRLLRVAIHALISYSSAPLRIAHVISFAFLLFGLVLGCEALVLKITGRAVSGFTTVIILLLLVGGAVLGVLGIISEYLAAIYDEVKHRPRFVIAETVGERLN
jgi:glycosyltransferase involved in cell wall biosynthesis